jgi:hypothetical protein
VLGLVFYYHSVNGSVFRKYNRISGIDDVISRCPAIRGCITYGMERQAGYTAINVSVKGNFIEGLSLVLLYQVRKSLYVLIIGFFFVHVAFLFVPLFPFGSFLFWDRYLT